MKKLTVDELKIVNTLIAHSDLKSKFKQFKYLQDCYFSCAKTYTIMYPEKIHDHIQQMHKESYDQLLAARLELDKIADEFIKAGIQADIIQKIKNMDPLFLYKDL